MALDAGTLLGASQRDLKISSGRDGEWVPRLPFMEEWDWRFEDPLLLKDLLAKLELDERDVVGNLLAKPRQPHEPSIYGLPFDLHWSIERNIKRLQSRTSYLGLELGADHTHPIRREGWPGVALSLAPRHFFLLALYCRAREEYTTKSFILQNWPPDAGHANDDVVYQANSVLRRNLKNVGLRIAIAAGPVAKWRLEEAPPSGQ